MTKRTILLLNFILLALLVGCGQPATPTTLPPTPTAPIPSPTKTQASTSTLAATASPPLPTRTAVKTPTPTTTPQGSLAARLQFQCLEILPQLPDGADSSGILVLESRVMVDSSHYSHDVFMLGMATGQTVQIAKPGENQIPRAVSPDRKHLAYESIFFDTKGEIVQDNLIIATADGQQKISIPWEEGWVGLPGWLNDQRLVIDISGLDPEENEVRKPATLLALNPFSNERQILRPDFPNLYALPPIPYQWGGWSLRTYDPALTRAAYLSFNKKGMGVLVLWDLQKQQALGSLSPYEGNIPIWSPDGSHLVTSAWTESQPAEELYWMSRGGQVEQLTNLNTYLEGGFFLNYDWSPNGRYIAALMSTDSIFESESVELVILDTTTKQMTGYCIRLAYGTQDTLSMSSLTRKQVNVQ
ncbi:MAG: hypothetical protein AB1894_11695 [Chloroflexota bacterium]